MREISEEFKSSIRQPLRNRGYIRASIGVVNSEAQKNAKIKNADEMEYYSNLNAAFSQSDVKLYATAEKDFSSVGGDMYFLPNESSGFTYYNNGIVTKSILGKIRIEFENSMQFDIKGLTIDFGDCYPTKFLIISDSGEIEYENKSRTFTTENSFDGTTYFEVVPIEMINVHGKLRILKITFGIANILTNENVLNCNIVEYTSPVAESLPSIDATITIDNQDLTYDVNDKDNVMSYLETGQEVKISFGYDVMGNGNIEWLQDITTYLDSWKSDANEAEFVTVDRFYQIDSIYYGGMYYEDGILLYDLALIVIKDAGITNAEEYYISNELKKVTIHNPLPAVTHAECLQIIANTARCALSLKNGNKICIIPEYKPDAEIQTSDMEPYGKSSTLLNGKQKIGYANCSKDFSKVDGSLYFLPSSSNDYMEDTGFVSEQMGCLEGSYPTILLNFDFPYTFYSLTIEFKNTAPGKIIVETYQNNLKVKEVITENKNMVCTIYDEFPEPQRVRISFLDVPSDQKTFVDNIKIGSHTNYLLERNRELLNEPFGSIEQKVTGIMVKTPIYLYSTEESIELLNDTVSVDSMGDGYTYVLYFTNASYGYYAEVIDNENVTVKIEDYSCWFVKIKFEGITTETEINFSINGKEYVQTEGYSKVEKSATRKNLIEWENPLAGIENAGQIAEWLYNYYDGEIDYEIEWRGDPSTEVGDEFWLELKSLDEAQKKYVSIKTYENSIEFNGAWSGNLKGKRM